MASSPRACEGWSARIVSAGSALDSRLQIRRRDGAQNVSAAGDAREMSVRLSIRGLTHEADGEGGRGGSEAECRGGCEEERG